MNNGGDELAAELGVWNMFQYSSVPTFKRMKEVMEQNKDEVLMNDVFSGVQKVS